MTVFNKLFKNKDLLVFWTAMVIAACDLLSSGFFAVQEVIAAPAPAAQTAEAKQDAAAQRWAERMVRLSTR